MCCAASITSLGTCNLYSCCTCRQQGLLNIKRPFNMIRWENVQKGSGWAMRGTPIIILFFLMFTTASILAPFPMFPGNFLCTKLGPTVAEYALHAGAADEALFYGGVVRLVVGDLSRKLGQEN